MRSRPDEDMILAAYGESGVTGRELLVFTSSPGVLSVAGEIDASNSEELLERICQEAGNGPFTLDLLEVDFIDSSGIRALLRAAARKDVQPPLRIKPSPAVVRLLEITQLDTVPSIEVLEGPSEGREAEPE